MKISFDRKEIKRILDLDFKNDKECVNYMYDLLDYLYYHNKNFTNKQYDAISNLRDMLFNMNIHGGLIKLESEDE